MITRETVSEKLFADLKQQISIEALVNWAENCFIKGGFSPDEDVDLLVGNGMYIAGGDTDYFPLTWDVITEFMQQLGAPITVVFE